MNAPILKRGSLAILILISFLMLKAVMDMEAIASILNEEVDLVSLDGSTGTQYNQQNPFLLFLPDRHIYFLVWEDWRNGNADIYGRFITPDGNLCGREFVIVNALGNQLKPMAAYRYRGFTGDKILVVWQDSRGNEEGGYIYFSTIDLGELDGGDNAACTSIADLDSKGLISVNEESSVPYKQYTGEDTLLGRESPDVAYLPGADTFLLAWTEYRKGGKFIQFYTGFSCADEGSGNCPYNRSYSALSFGDGTFIGYARLSGANLEYSVNPDIVRTDHEATNDFHNVRRLVRQYIRGDTTITEYKKYEFYDSIGNARVVADINSNKGLFLWTGQRNIIEINSVCTPTGGEGALCGTRNCQCIRETTTEGGETSCETWEVDTVCDDRDDVIVHEETITSESYTEVAGIFDINIGMTTSSMRFSSKSTSSSEEESSTYYGTFYPNGAFDPITGRFLIAWEDLGADGKAKIWGRLVNSSGIFYGPSFIISYEDIDEDGQIDEYIRTSRQTSPYVAFDPINQRFFIAWEDDRNGQYSLENLDIYGQFIDSEGSFRGNNFVITTNSYNQWFPVMAFDHDNARFLAVWKDARFSREFCGVTACGSEIFGRLFDLGQPRLYILNSDGVPLVPPVINFKNLQGTASINLELANRGDALLRLDCIVQPSTPFSVDNLPDALQGCDDGSSLQLLPDSSIELAITASPEEEGMFADKFIVKSDAGELTVNLQVNSLITKSNPALVNINPSTVDFSEVKTGETASVVITFKNNGNTKAQIVAVDGLTEPFYISALGAEETGQTGGQGLVGTIIEGGDELKALVRFIPQEAGSYSANVKILMDYQTDTPLILKISGAAKETLTATDENVVPNVTITPSTVSFPPLKPNDTSSVVLTLKNTGNANAQIVAVDGLSSPFSLSLLGVTLTSSMGSTGSQQGGQQGESASLVGTVLNSGEEKKALLRFTPQETGNYTALIKILMDYQTYNPLTVTVSGTAIQTANPPSVSISPSTVSFPQVKPNEAASVIVTFKNSGDTDARIVAIDGLSGPFSIEPFEVEGDSLIVKRGGELKALVRFTPQEAGSYSSTVKILMDYQTDSPLILNLIGTAIQAVNPPSVSISPSTVSFPQVKPNEAASVIVTFKNSGDTDARIVAIDGLSGPFSIEPFEVEGDSLIVKRGGELKALVRFTPQEAGSYSSTVKILMDYQTDSPLILNLLGNAKDEQATAAPSMPTGLSYSTEYILYLDRTNSYRYVINRGQRLCLPIAYDFSSVMSKPSVVATQGSFSINTFPVSGLSYDGVAYSICIDGSGDMGAVNYGIGSLGISGTINVATSSGTGAERLHNLFLSQGGDVSLKAVSIDTTVGNTVDFRLNTNCMDEKSAPLYVVLLSPQGKLFSYVSQGGGNVWTSGLAPYSNTCLEAVSGSVVFNDFPVSQTLINGCFLLFGGSIPTVTNDIYYDTANICIKTSGDPSKSIEGDWDVQVNSPSGSFNYPEPIKIKNFYGMLTATLASYPLSITIKGSGMKLRYDDSQSLINYHINSISSEELMGSIDYQTGYGSGGGEAVFRKR